MALLYYGITKYKLDYKVERTATTTLHCTACMQRCTWVKIS